MFSEFDSNYLKFYDLNFDSRIGLPYCRKLILNFVSGSNFKKSPNVRNFSVN